MARKKLTPRGRAMRWLSSHRGVTEQPANSNTDRRKDGIRAAQERVGRWLIGAAWCGVWCVNAALAAGVKIARPYRWASVAYIEDDAKARTNGFRGWTTPRTRGWHKRVLRADLAIVGGRGVHVETVRELLKPTARHPYWRVVTDGGNTSPGDAGSQSNGGGAYRRVRPIAQVYGFALVDYPDA